MGGQLPGGEVVGHGTHVLHGGREARVVGGLGVPGGPPRPLEGQQRLRLLLVSLGGGGGGCGQKNKS